MSGRRRAVLIAGPTASGKSALALGRAQTSGGVIINADAMQVYDTLAVLTARPSPEDAAAAEHRLYGAVSAGERFSTGHWVRVVEEILAEIDPAREAIFVGGTGLYFDALINGFADVPDVPAEVISAVEREIAGLDEAGRMARLQVEDPDTAARLKIADPQRVIRALAVKRSTGHALSSYQKSQRPGLLRSWHVEPMVLEPPRSILRERIAHRFETMLDKGAVEEVEALRRLALDPALPAMKAIGVREISDWLDGLQSRDDAMRLSIIATHQYAKRQGTWFRNRMAEWPRINPG